MTSPTSESELDEKLKMEIVLALGYLKFEAPDVYLRVVDDVVELIAQERTKAEIEARIDEWDYIHETMHVANQTATEYATETMKDRIATLEQQRKEL